MACFEAECDNAERARLEISNARAVASFAAILLNRCR